LSKFITVLEVMRNTNQYRVCPLFGGDYSSTSVEWARVESVVSMTWKNGATCVLRTWYM